MPLLSAADALFLGDQAVDAVYVGATKAWPAPPAYDALDTAILALDPLHYWRMDGSAPFIDHGSDPVDLTVSVDNGLLTNQTVAGKLTGVLLPRGTVLIGAGCVADPSVGGEGYLFFTDVNDTTNIDLSGVSGYNSDLRLRSQYSTGVSFAPNWRVTGTNRNPSSLSATGVPAMYSGDNANYGNGRVFSEAQYPLGGGNSGAQGVHSFAGLDLYISASGTEGSVTLARVVVLDTRPSLTDLQAVFDAYVAL